VPQEVSYGQAVRTWAYIGLNSFGGPAGQIAVMHRVLVDEKRWISEERFLHALNYCMLLPGPEATQLATYVGWLMHKTRGGLTAGILFVLPGFVSLLLLSILYSTSQDLGLVAAVFFGLKPAVLAVVVEAVMRIGRRVLKNAAMLSIAGAAFVAIFVFAAPFPLIIAGAALLGLVGGRLWPGSFLVITGQKVKGETAAPTVLGDATPEHARPSALRTARTLALWLLVWAAPVALLLVWLGPAHVFSQIAVFFSEAAVVTFGGAYSVLAFIAQRAVETYHWLTPPQMLDGLGLAETTPGPLIQVVQFVAYMGAYKEHGGLPPVAAGIVASVIVTWVTYVPCFLWIFVGAPYIERLRGNRALTAALSAITAAVVGVVLNLAEWFALHVLFARVSDERRGWAVVHIPDWSTARPAMILLALVAAGLLFWAKLGMMRTLGVCVVLGAGWWAVARYGLGISP
jgi:chromate transporter